MQSQNLWMFLKKIDLNGKKLLVVTGIGFDTTKGLVSAGAE